MTMSRGPPKKRPPTPKTWEEAAMLKTNTCLTQLRCAPPPCAGVARLAAAAEALSVWGSLASNSVSGAELGAEFVTIMQRITLASLKCVARRVRLARGGAR